MRERLFATSCAWNHSANQPKTVRSQCEPYIHSYIKYMIIKLYAACSPREWQHKKHKRRWKKGLKKKTHLTLPLKSLSRLKNVRLFGPIRAVVSRERNVMAMPKMMCACRSSPSVSDCEQLAHNFDSDSRPFRRNMGKQEKSRLSQICR